MERWTSRTWLLAATGLLVLVFSGEASAYIDPGTGSLILQMLIAVVVGTGFALGVFWKQVKGFFVRLFGGKPKTQDSDKDKDHVEE